MGWVTDITNITYCIW